MSFTVAGKPVGPIGFGMMSLSKNLNIEESFATLKAALNAGANLWNAGEFYGTADNNSLHLLNRYFTKYPEDTNKVVISVKGCFNIEGAQALNDETGVKGSIENCLRILNGKCKIAIFEAARGDPDVPIETTVGAIARYVKAGKIGSIGLSECSAATIRKATAVHPIAAVEVELSLLEAKVLTNGVADACRELKIPIVAYSPLGNGFLSGELKEFNDIPPDDHRRYFPRFQSHNFDSNIRVAHQVEMVANAKGCSMAQVAIAWVLAQAKLIGTPVIPIPGTAIASVVEENMKPAELTDEDVSGLSDAVANIEVKGDRAPGAYKKYLVV
ncbi:aldo/keto reductase [Piedraia hortae CBS 480.64]|uniref:Aldo/keto reductase n=1 Tax=Piedraia hortae CBS 480.64 TaxID=1314780 RepID=A0A6A7C0B2_9PEZI|nr:aldo/keto reductase [Piedraia hortae CBS 480.64]